MKFRYILFTVALLATGFAIFADAQENKGHRAFLTRFLAGLELGDAIVADHVVVFPIVAAAVPDPLPVLPARPSETVVYEEIEFPDQPYDLSVRNEGAAAVLLLGGDVLVGGKLDRLVMRDMLVAPGSRVEFGTLPAEYPRDVRSVPAPFTAGSAFAPEFLRERAVFDPARFMVPIFLSHLLEFRNAGDQRHSLQALSESAQLKGLCAGCQKALAEFPAMSEGRTVGFITAIHGRLHDLELFGTADLLRAWFPSILRAQAYAAAGIEARAQRAGAPLGDFAAQDDASRKASRVEAIKLLESLGAATIRAAHLPPQAAGQVFLLRAGSAQGLVIGDGDRLLHAAVYPETPLEGSLFSRPVAPPGADPVETAETGFGELERRAERGRLTPAEERILQRMRARLGGDGPVPPSR